MSSENVKKFFEAVRKDEKAVERLRALETDVEAFSRLSAELGRERGFAFEPSDVRELLESLGGKAEGQLSDKELAAVSGGGQLSVMPLCFAVHGGVASSGCVVTPRAFGRLDEG